MSWKGEKRKSTAEKKHKEIIIIIIIVVNVVFTLFITLHIFTVFYKWTFDS